MRYYEGQIAALALEDGRIFRGEPFGARTEVGGEIVFTTTMTGYQEVATDPSFNGQVVCFTYPLIGNYGVTPADDESFRPWARGVIVREYSDEPSNWRSVGTFDSYLRQHNIPGIMGVDTRALTRHLRDRGLLRGVIVPDRTWPERQRTGRARQQSAAAVRIQCRRRRPRSPRSRRPAIRTARTSSSSTVATSATSSARWSGVA